jgi:hypothetical protein
MNTCKRGHQYEEWQRQCPECARASHRTAVVG